MGGIIGGTGTNDIGNLYAVTGVGITKAANITFRAESVYMTSASTYAQTRTYTIQAATDLYGASSAEVAAVTNAWYAVGIGTAALARGTEAFSDETRIYPNPSENVFTIELKSVAEKGTLAAIYSLDGKLVHQENITATQWILDLEALEAGIYILTLQDDFRNSSYKLVKQ